MGTGGPPAATTAPGYWLPAGWQHTEADPAVLEHLAPGMAVCAVMGHGIDALDVDPHKGGEESHADLADAGIWPTVLAQDCADEPDPRLNDGAQGR